MYHGVAAQDLRAAPAPRVPRSLRSWLVDVHMLLRPAPRRRTRGCAALAAVLAAEEACCLDDGTDPLPPAYLRVAFLGGELGFWNDLPSQLERLSLADAKRGHAGLLVGKCFRVNGSLSQLADGCSAAPSSRSRRARCNAARRPKLGGRRVDGMGRRCPRRRAAGASERADAGRRHRGAPQRFGSAAAARRPGQKPTRALLLQTWAFARPVRGTAALGGFEGVHSALRAGYEAYAALRGAGLSDADVAPAGDARIGGGRTRTFVRLYNPNAVHPSVGGTYLAAAVLYAALTRRDVRHLNVPSCAPEMAPCAMALRPAEDTYLRDVAARAVEMARARERRPVRERAEL